MTDRISDIRERHQPDKHEFCQECMHLRGDYDVADLNEWPCDAAYILTLCSELARAWRDLEAVLPALQNFVDRGFAPESTGSTPHALLARIRDLLARPEVLALLKGDTE